MKERELDKLLKNQAKFCEKICEALDNRGFGCNGCNGNCCNNQVIGLLRSEVIDIANHLNISKGEFRRKYTTILTHPTNNTRIRCLKPNIDNEGREVCGFLIDNKCTIYQVRPHSCRQHPFYFHSKQKLVSVHGTMACPLVYGFNKILTDYKKKHNLDNVSKMINEAPYIPLDIVKRMLDL